MFRFAAALIVVPAFAQFGQMANQQGGQKKGQDMFGMFCDMISFTGMCKEGNQGEGLNSKECLANPGACCKTVDKCSPTDPFAMFGSACPKSLGASAQCVGSVMTSPTKVGVCMCQTGTTCSGSGQKASCVSGVGGAMNTAANMVGGFSRLYEEEEYVPKAGINYHGLVVMGAMAGAFSLSVMMAVRGIRFLTRSNQEVHQVLIDDEESEAFNE
mmetsp:Transcript_44257/g.96301  ORF Transcript_44257/g.96301 Transcript_44257/m.96301 type:complete len:214 (-) Transcript_44257:120-761(-)